MRRWLCVILSVCVVIAASADDRWMHVFRTEGAKSRVSSFPIEDVRETNFHEDGANRSVRTMSVTTHDGLCTDIDLCTVDSCVIGGNIPTIYIDVDKGAEVTDKENWLHADISIRAYGNFEDLGEAEVTIKGRGNSTWNFPKKPYTVKFTKKTQIGSLRKAKNFVLLANYIDCTLMRNVAAFKIASLMGLPYTNNFQPVNLVVNGSYRGSYLLTEKVGINAGSVNINEETGVLFELDSNYDEDFKFVSDVYSLPVMVKDPDFNDIAAGSGQAAPDSLLREWQADFQKMEDAVAGLSDTDYTSLVDLQSVVDYMLVNCVCANREINHPKSFYIYKKTRSTKYYFGPVWDFDWAFTFDANTEGYVPYTRTLITSADAGGKFLKALANNADFVWKYTSRWRYFHDTVWPKVLEFMDEYAETIYVSALQNGERWPQDDMVWTGIKSTETFRANYATFRSWLQKRVDYLDTHIHHGLW